MKQPTIEIPFEYKRLFDSDWREAAVYGGRYSLKSHTVARVLLIQARMEKLRIACFREFQNSIAESSHQLLSDLIEMYGLKEFSVTDNSIINKLNGSDFLFKGLHHNEQSIKSIEGIDKAWCFVAGTLVDGKPIETLRPGDYVKSFNHLTNKIEYRKVLRATKRKTPKKLYKVLVQHGLHSIILTEEHPIYIKGKGYVPVSNIKNGDTILYEETKPTRNFTLFGWLRREDSDRHARQKGQIQEKRWHLLLGLRKKKPIQPNEDKQSDGQPRSKSENGQGVKENRPQAKNTWWKWQGLYSSTTKTIRGIRAWLVERVSSNYSPKGERLPNKLQVRPGERILHVSDRMRWWSTPWRNWKNGRQEKDSVLREYRVDSIEIQKQEDIKRLQLSDGGNYVYNIEVEVNNNYFANGILSHNCEEAQSISTKSLEVLTPTVRKPGSQLIYTYNRLLEQDPVHVRLVIEGRPNTLIINANYDIAEKYGWLPKVVKNEIEDDRINRPALYKHKWLGEPNSLERRVYQGWKRIETVPHEARLIRRGLDFGYSKDPTAVIAIYEYNGGYILDEELYRKGMKNNDIGAFLKNVEELNTLVVGDSSEPKSIADLQEQGINILGVKKIGEKDEKGNKKSFKQYMIDFVKQKKISYTARSKNLEQEYLTYYHKEDKDGNILNDPEDGNDHAMDALGYGFMGIRPEKKIDIPAYVPTNFMTQ